MKKQFLLPFMALAFCTLTHASIVYRDIPDGIPSGLDFNSDGANEFTISNDIGSGLGTYIMYTSPSNIYSPSSNQWDIPAALNAGTVIGPAGNWFGFGDCTVPGYTRPTSFPLNVDSYLGVKINISGTIYYGWVRISLTPYGTGPMGTTYQATYKDYAYENTPNTPINAGNTGALSIEDNPLFNIVLFPNPVSEYLCIKSRAPEFTEFGYQIFDNFGKTLLSGSSEFDNKIFVGALPAGTYLLHLESRNTIFNKVFIKLD